MGPYPGLRVIILLLSAHRLRALRAVPKPSGTARDACLRIAALDVLAYCTPALRVLARHASKAVA